MRPRVLRVVAATAVGASLRVTPVAASAGDAAPDAHSHGTGVGALVDGLLESGPVAAPFLAIVIVMLVANARANRLARGGRSPGSRGPGPHDAR